MKKRIFSVLLCLLLLFSLTACGDGGFTPSQKAFDTEVKASVPSDDQVITQNSKYSLEFDAETTGVVLVETATGTKWEVCPTPTGEQEFDSLGMPVKRHSFPQSVLEVGYMDTKISGGGNMVTTTYDGVVDFGRIVYKPIDNGVTVEYYFESQEFMIPVDYVLYDDYLSISVDTTKIQENYMRVTYVSLAPFLCSVQNDTPDSYLFMPSGSGALLDTTSFNDQGLKYNAYIYGDDLTMEERYSATNQNYIRMPVYGYKSGNKGGFAIIDKGADAALMNSCTGNTAYKFSTIYPSFQLRGFTNHEATSFNSTYNANIYPNNMIEGTVSIRFYPLANENANYSAMADIYRDYLIAEKGLSKTDTQQDMSVTILGGTMITKSFLGVPYKTLLPTTTLEQASTIVSEISESVDNLAVKLKGFTASGVDIGKIGGSYALGDGIGSVSQLKDFSALCIDKNVDMYFDYDLVRFGSSGKGFSTFSDSVMNSGVIKADQFIFDKAVRNNEEKLKYRLLRPVCFVDAVSKAVDKNNDFKLGGISFETLTSLSYSDYSDYNLTTAYNSKHLFGDAVSTALAQVKEGGQKFMATSANDYAAVVADIIVDTPTTSDDGISFVEDVPFYSMVFRGYTSLTGESINLSDNSKKAILGAVEGGIGLNYTLISQWDNSLIDALYPYFYSTVYSGVKDDMLATYGDLADYFDSIKGAKITSNTVVSSGVHSTVFDNGVTVYVNYNNKTVQTPVGEIGALDYIITGGAA